MPGLFRGIDSKGRPLVVGGEQPRDPGMHGAHGGIRTGYPNAAGNRADRRAYTKATRAAAVLRPYRFTGGPWNGKTVDRPRALTGTDHCMPLSDAPGNGMWASPDTWPGRNRYAPDGTSGDVVLMTWRLPIGAELAPTGPVWDDVHDTSIAGKPSDPTAQAVCTCGWPGGPVRTGNDRRWQATADADQHHNEN